MTVTTGLSLHTTLMALLLLHHPNLRTGSGRIKKKLRNQIKKKTLESARPPRQPHEQAFGEAERTNSGRNVALQHLDNFQEASNSFLMEELEDM
jgi:hypothetical protein